DRVNHRVRGRRNARLTAITCGGAIPETGLYTVVAEPEGITVGTVDEDFAVESLAGDVMLLGNMSWRIRRVSNQGRVIVEDAHGDILAGRAVLGAVPTDRSVIAERFFDEGGGMQLVIHSPFGARINKAWGLALRKRFCRSFNFELQAAATDNGINIALAEQHSFPLADVFHFLSAETVQDVLVQAACASPIFGTRWRWDANRSLALLRFQGGKKV